ncbi:MAG: hypothetical protein JSR36_13650 [Proteobacteria bacterium]|nr:hypothetical protein [Pseudomonadota bacterium]
MDSLLSGWESFYVIVGSSAGGLTGLTFVVIALAADSRKAGAAGLRAFVTPIVLHFGQVLALAAFLSMPHPSTLALSIGFTAAGIVGLVWSGVILANIPRNSTEYQPVWEDWLWNVILPVIAYLLMIAAAYALWHHTAAALYMVGGATLGLLFIGIHNAWDIAVWMTLARNQARKGAP